MSVSPSHDLDSSDVEISFEKSFDHFQKEIREKDPDSATFGEGFEFFEVMNPVFCGEDLWFQVFWKHENLYGLDYLESHLVNKLCVDAAIKFYEERFNKEPKDNTEEN